jgi:hypothetical protein
MQVPMGMTANSAERSSGMGAPVPRRLTSGESCLPNGRPGGGVLLTAGAYGRVVIPQATVSLVRRNMTQPPSKAVGGTAYVVKSTGVLIWRCLKGVAGEASLRSVIASIR